MVDPEHYDKNTLWRFATGVLTGTDAADIEEHIQACPQCSALLAGLTLDDDPLVRKLRQMKSGQGRLSPKEERLDGKVLILEVIERKSVIFRCELKRPIEIGRQTETELAALGSCAGADLDRLVIAPLNFRAMSRKHLRLTPIPPSTVIITSLTSKGDILINGKVRLTPGQHCDVTAPAEFFLGQHTLRLSVHRSE